MALITCAAFPTACRVFADFSLDSSTPQQRYPINQMEHLKRNNIALYVMYLDGVYGIYMAFAISSTSCTRSAPRFVWKLPKFVEIVFSNFPFVLNKFLCAAFRCSRFVETTCDLQCWKKHLSIIICRLWRHLSIVSRHSGANLHFTLHTQFQLGFTCRRSSRSQLMVPSL